jgi:hypothetical protein
MRAMPYVIDGAHAIRFGDGVDVGSTGGGSSGVGADVGAGGGCWLLAPPSELLSPPSEL